MGRKPETKGTPKKNWRPAFLAALRSSPNVSAAAKAAKISRAEVYRTRDDEPDFAKDWDDALEESMDTAEGEAYRRAVRGTRKPVYQGGELVGHVQEYSDTLLIFLLKSHRPKTYRETSRVLNLNADLTSLTDDELDELERKLSR